MNARPPLGLRLLAPLVPGPRRRDWLREWSAEHAWRLRSGRGVVALWRAALEDALVLRLRTFDHGSLAMDLRYAMRSLVRRPGFATVVIATLALGLGANVAIFSVIRGVAYRPLPYDAPAELAQVAVAFPRAGYPTFPTSGPEFVEIRTEHPAFARVAGYYASESNLGGLDTPRRVGVVAATADVLDVLGVAPAHGRGFLAGEDRPGQERVALLTHGLWTDAFGAQADVVGETVLVDERPHTVVGILPREFEFPGYEADLLVALHFDPADPGGRTSHWLSMVARLRPGVTPSDARALSEDFVARTAEAFPDRHGPSPEHPVAIRGLREAMVTGTEGPLRLLALAVGLVLLVACLNVANLLLVRGEDRRQEFGVRTALGAGHGALARQIMTETGVLVALGAAAGVGLAWLLVQALPGLLEGSVPPNADIVLNRTVLAFAAALATAVAFGVGLVPLLGGLVDPSSRLRASGRRATPGRARLAFRRAMVVVEVAAAVALVAGAGVLTRSFGELMSVDTGLRSGGVALIDVELTAGSYPETEDVAAFHAELKRRAEATPGIDVVGAIRTAPLTGGGGIESVEVLDSQPPDEANGLDWTVQYQVADPGIFAALGVPVLQGRSLEPGDGTGSPAVVVVNEAAARSLFGADDPLGRRIRLGFVSDNPNPVMSVVGVVGDVRQGSLEAEAPAQIYVPRAQAGANYGGLGSRMATVVARTQGDPQQALVDLRRVVREIDPGLPVAGARTLREQIVRSVGDRRFLAVLMGLFSATAAALGAVGLYGLIAYVVGRRSHEFGIRIALGAERGQMVGGVLGEAVTLVAAGCAAGVAAAWFCAGLLEGLVYGVEARDPLSFVGAPLLLVAVGVVAAWIPARRAAAVDPVRVLHSD